MHNEPKNIYIYLYINLDKFQVSLRQRKHTDRTHTYHTHITLLRAHKLTDLLSQTSHGLHILTGFTHSHKLAYQTHTDSLTNLQQLTHNQQ